jgi:hypothetical protein
LPLDRQRKRTRKSEDQKSESSSFEYEKQNKGEDEEKWNDMDSEVVERNDTRRNSVIETSENILMEPIADVSNQFLSNALGFESFSVNAGDCPVKPLARSEDRKD